METTIDEKRVESLLGRSLSKTEADNFELYLNLAKISVGDLICTNIDEMGEIPVDLELVIARFFDALTKEQSLKGDVQSKKVEDFSITYKDGYQPREEVMQQCRATLIKYSQCSGGIEHGRTIYDAYCV